MLIQLAKVNNLIIIIIIIPSVPLIHYSCANGMEYLSYHLGVLLLIHVFFVSKMLSLDFGNCWSSCSYSTPQETFLCSMFVLQLKALLLLDAL
jgi:hypothetical protein